MTTEELIAVADAVKHHLEKLKLYTVAEYICQNRPELEPEDGGATWEKAYDDLLDHLVLNCWAVGKKATAADALELLFPVNY